MSTEDTTPRPDGHAAEPLALRLNDQLGQASEARWYCLDRDGVAMLCKDEEDARAQAIENNDCWPGRAPHRAVLLGDVAAERERCGQVYGSREVAMSDEIRRLAREAHTWSKAAESYAADAERFRWLAEHTVATGLARWVHPFQFLGEAVDARRNEATTNAAPRVTTAAELRQQAKSDTSCVGAFARARPGKA